MMTDHAGAEPKEYTWIECHRVPQTVCVTSQITRGNLPRRSHLPFECDVPLLNPWGVDVRIRHAKVTVRKVSDIRTRCDRVGFASVRTFLAYAVSICIAVTLAPCTTAPC